MILIAYLPSGLILYWFIRIPDYKLDNLSDVPDLSPFWWLFGSTFLSYWYQINQNLGNGSGLAPSPSFVPSFAPTLRQVLRRTLHQVIHQTIHQVILMQMKAQIKKSYSVN